MLRAGPLILTFDRERIARLTKGETSVSKLKMHDIRRFPEDRPMAFKAANAERAAPLVVGLILCNYLHSLAKYQTFEYGTHPQIS